MNRLIHALLLACLLLPGLAAAAPAALPDDSIYLLEDAFSDQAGQPFVLADRRGKPQVVAMFYTSCRYICPLIVDSAKGVEHALSPAERSRLGILLVSLDPTRDDTAALASVAAKRKLDPARWTLARTEAAGVRRVAALLGIRYRALADGEFNHSSALVLLDAQGRVLARTETLGSVPDPAFLAAVKAALAAPAG
ncbi:MAG TPA: SCO family protein [Arenimonas sp.]|uniref:SCO family protein n=1 Tax=Arenimonas sp. TaxID=1872635 RepID=UPI002D7E62D3|nr:SCO family protein [Arenimonas sp.]HEU0153062.1 SCO family protein [Arenimonas sp.]